MSAYGDAPPGSVDPRGDRVRLSHLQTLTTIRSALLFVVAAALAAAFSDGTWLPLHLFLAGAVTLAISGVSLMLAVTWSAAPAPSSTLVGVQRASIAAGAAGVALSRESGLPDAVTGGAGVVFVAGLVLLSYLLVTIVRRGSERRFDVAVAFQVSALVAAIAGVGVGVHMAAAGATPGLRSAHVTVNLLGFVGLTIAGTLPFFAATVGRSRMAPGATPLRLAILLGSMVLSIGLIVGGVLTESDGVTFWGLGGYAYGVVASLCFMPRPTRRQWEWSGPRLMALWLGGLWWIGGIAATAAGVVGDDGAVFQDRWLLVVVVGGYAQILWGSLAYLIPMLRGGGHRNLSEGFARTRSWVGLASVNAAAAALALDVPDAALAFIALAVLDGSWRTVRVGLARLPRPDERRSSPGPRVGAPGPV